MTLQEVKANNPLEEYLPKRGVEFEKGKFFKCLFHSEKNASMHVHNDRLKCFGCGWSGDVLDCEKELGDYANVYEAAEALHGGKIDSDTDYVAKERPAPVQADPAPVSGDAKETWMEAVKFLMDRPKLIDQIARARKWKPETVKLEAERGNIGVAIYPNDDYSAKLFGKPRRQFAMMYRGGWKVRFNHEGERIVRWVHGSATDYMYREHRILTAEEKLPHDAGIDPLPTKQKIYVTEGETDAIRLVDIGLESYAEPPEWDCSKVVGLPSSSTFSERWVDLLAGNMVVLCPDGDIAGSKMMNRLWQALHGKTTTLSVIDVNSL